MKIKVPCVCTKQVDGRKPTPGKIRCPEGQILNCAYCKGSGEREETVPHPSHVMSEWRTEIRCPSSTPRFYGVRVCRGCGSEEMRHAAGHFLDDLVRPCCCPCEKKAKA